MPENTIIDLIRHGEPEGGRKYRGHLDDPLSEKGWRQMWDAVGDFAGWHLILTSPLLRCADFAEALGEKLAVGVLRDPRLREGGVGVWEGRRSAEICADDPLRVFDFKHDPVARAPAGAEPVLEVHARVGAAWAEMLGQHRGRHLLVVAHAGVIRMLLAHALGLPPDCVYRIHVGNASLSRLQVDHQGERALPTLMFHDGRL